MRCPNCVSRIRRGDDRCHKCGTKVSEIKKASFKKAIQARKEYQPDLVVYSTVFPEDLSFKMTLLLCIVFGWMGLHCYYVQRKFKAILLTCFTAVFVLFIIPFGMFMQGQDIGFLSGFMSTMLSSGFYVIPCALGAVCVVLWILDIFALCFKNFPVPVVMPETEQANQTFPEQKTQTNFQSTKNSKNKSKKSKKKH